jgi:hypothetical protein
LSADNSPLGWPSRVMADAGRALRCAAYRSTISGCLSIDSGVLLLKDLDNSAVGSNDACPMALVAAIEQGDPCRATQRPWGDQGTGRCARSSHRHADGQASAQALEPYDSALRRCHPSMRFGILPKKDAAPCQPAQPPRTTRSMTSMGCRRDVDTSAILTVALNEPEAKTFKSVLFQEVLAIGWPRSQRYRHRP